MEYSMRTPTSSKPTSVNNSVWSGKRSGGSDDLEGEWDHAGPSVRRTGLQ